MLTLKTKKNKNKEKKEEKLCLCSSTNRQVLLQLNRSRLSHSDTLQVISV